MTNKRVDLQSVLRLSGPEADLAFHTLTGEVPPEYVSTRQARGKSSLSYVKHQVVNRLMLQAFGPYWSWDVQSTGFAPQGRTNKKTGEVVTIETAWARGTLTLYVQVESQILSVTTTGVSMFDNTFKLPEAAARASAASRALCKAVAMKCGFGLEFYGETDVRMTSKRAWSLLQEYAIERGVAESVLVTKIKALGIDSAQLRDPDIFRQVWAMIYELGENEGEEMPTEPKPEPKESPATEMTEEKPDPVTEAAKELGGKVIEEKKEEAPKEDSVKVNWIRFYGKCDTELGIGSSTEARSMLTDIFGKKDLTRVSEATLLKALKEFMATKDNDERQVLREKYHA